MKRCFVPSLTILSMLLASPLRADAPGQSTTEESQPDDSSLAPASTEEAQPEGSSLDQTSTEDTLAEEPASVQPVPEEEGTPVGQASNEGSRTAKKQMWQNIGLAVGAVAIAVTALILVSTNDGHRSHHKK